MMEQAEMDTTAIDQRRKQQELERARVHEDMLRDITMQRLEWGAEIASGMENVFADMYELSGNKAKAWFYLEKAAAIARIIINTQVAAMRALAEMGPIAGKVMAAVIYAQGATAIAKAASQQAYASGGEVKGRSPHKRADNIPVWVTGRSGSDPGEFIHPVEVVKYYGTNIMEAMRQKLIPPQLLQGYKVPVPVYASRRGYAEGGEVKTRAEVRNPGQRDVVVAPAPPINIVNIVDSGEMDKYLHGSTGQNAILNVLSSRKEVVRRILK
jgi:hypothetical protein